MLRRYQAALSLLPQLSFRPATALRAALREGYGRKQLVRDAMAGIVVGVVALPLAMALAINSGVAPQHGIYTAIVAGAVVAILGGSRTQVTGPTAAFIVILAPIASQYGLGGLMVATVMAGLILVAMGAARLGRLIEFIPHPVTTGFTAGIAVVIATTQVDKIFGLEGKFRDHWLDRVADLIQAAPTAKWQDFIIAALTLGLLIAWPRYNKKIPAPVVALGAAGVVGVLFTYVLHLPVTTLADKFSWAIGGHAGHGIPPYPPLPQLPWNSPGADGQPLKLSFEMISTLAPKAMAIAMLGAIESLLCAVVADGMAGTRHDPDSELLAQGIGNIVSPFFGGIASTGAIARTATNIRAGGKSPIASLCHAVFVLLGVVILAPLLGFLPMPAMAALLLLVAWNMSEVRHFRHILHVAPRSDVLVLITCFSLTVLFDMVLSVSVGVMLAALLFMRRMAELSQGKLIAEKHHAHGALPRDVMFYEIDGPLFFGAAQKAIDALSSVNQTIRVLILDLEDMPAMDVSGLVAFESAISRVQKLGAYVLICGVQAQPRSVLEKAGIVDTPDKLKLCATVEEAVKLARERSLESLPVPSAPRPPPPADGTPEPAAPAPEPAASSAAETASTPSP
jgi:SulP family sulfate permease